MIENNLQQISQKLQQIAPIDWKIDISNDSAYLYIERKDGKMMKQAEINFFEEAAQDIAKLIIEVKSLREVNHNLKRQIVDDYENKIKVDKDLRFI